MKKEIVELIISELLKRVEEIKRLEIEDRVAYIGFLIQEIAGIPAIYLPSEVAEEILNAVGERVRLSNNSFCNF